MAELRRVAEVIDAGAQAPPLQGRLAPEVLEALAALVHVDVLTYLDLEPAMVTVHIGDETAGGRTTYSGAPAVEPESAFWRHYAATAFCSYPTRTGDHRTVTRRSDFYSTREWRQTPMYVDYAGLWGWTHEMLCPLPSTTGRSRRLVLARTGSRDFTEDDRLALALLRPHLAEMIGRRHEPGHVASLTERQRELLQLVAQGHTNGEIAAALHLSPHTVRTHLANIFERLDVTTRAAAVAKACLTV